MRKPFTCYQQMCQGITNHNSRVKRLILNIAIGFFERKSDMELRQLKTFQTVATLLSFNRAAEALNYAQSTISAQIRGLEEDLDVKLFDRLENV